MCDYTIGTVKWYRDDGTGYIEAGGVTFYVDSSVVLDGSRLDRGVRVTFRPTLILDRWCAREVTTRGVVQPGDRDDLRVDFSEPAV